ncbi:MAG: Maf family nucleotide pyrophosphatase [Lachnospiraceae bacterium]|nr:Maf family nucleotide pyrophosphatase [Lachnospiraceae bacterium]
MITFYLIRHGRQNSSDCNVNVPLSEEGREQARLLGKRMAKYPIDALYSSDLIRAVETADIAYEQMQTIRNGLDLKHQIDPDFQELDFGDLTGQPDAVSAEFLGHYWDTHQIYEEDMQFPNGENSYQVAERVERAILRIVKKGTTRHNMIVMHGMALRCYLAHKFATDAKRRVDFGRHLENTSITKVLYDEESDRWFLESFNDCAHLEDTPQLLRSAWNRDMSKQQVLQENFRIILASASPRRKELLSQAGYRFDICVSEEEENPKSSIPNEVVEELAVMKAKSVEKMLEQQKSNKLNSDYIIIGADTIVTLDGKILGKPADEEDAIRMLKSLSGRTHEVYTGVAFCLQKEGKKQTVHFHECTKVKILPMTREEIVAYVKTKDPLDKAGSYGIQGVFAPYVEGIVGDYYNVVGLPISRLVKEIKKEFNSVGEIPHI